MEMETAAIAAVALVGLAVAVVNLLARRLRVPPVLLYLIVGVVGGRSVTNFFHPDELGEIFPVGLEVLVGLLVFEGAFSIDVHYLRRVGAVVRNLLTVGLVITFVSGALLAGLLEVLPWRTALMFGALVTVTGPTVIGPLVRATRLNDRVRAVLLGEGVLIDPLGAILAVVMLHFAIAGFHIEDIWWAPMRLGGGFLFGLVGVAAVRGVIRLHDELSPREMLLLLMGASIATFGFSEHLMEGSALTAMATMGVVLAGMHLPHAEEVRDFEDEFSRILIAGIYVLAASTLELQLLFDLWPRGFIVVLALMVLVRPLSVAICSLRSDLRLNERGYIAAIAPRGVVAVALAAFAGERLGEELDGGHLTALVFLTVAVTIAVQSTYAAPLARRMEVRAMRALIAGAGKVSRRIGAQLRAGGFDVTLIDQNEDAVARARAERLEAEVGDASNVSLLRKLGGEEAAIAVGATDSDEVNLLFCQYMRAESPEASAFARVEQSDAVEAFRRAGIATIGADDAIADAMMTMIGQPALWEALALGGEDRLTVEILVGAGLDGLRVRDLALPHQVLVLLVRRADADEVPHGETRLERGNRLLLFGSAGVVTEARERLSAR